jgi:tRNA A-37 threonylcarbamoyl transferase component Bud32
VTAASAADELPQVLGEFAIERELGRGGSGVVYAAAWQGHAMALKVLRPDEAATPKERDRFLGEARLLAKVQHPGVVRVFTSGVLPDGRPYLGMERLTGAALAERLLMGRLAVGQALGLFEQIAAAVSALHAAGIVHRDIKPENIMLVDGGQRAVLLDFGIARGVDDAASTTTQMGLQRGTPAYMAPERFFGARATIGSDVYETAVVLFVMLTGHLPWRDPKDPHARLEPRTPSAIGVDLPTGLERELMRALSPKPEGRPASIEELAAAVRSHAWEGDTVRAHTPAARPGAAPIAATTQRVRRPLILGGVLAAIAAGVAAAIIVLMSGRGGTGVEAVVQAGAGEMVDAAVVGADAGSSGPTIIVLPVEGVDAGLPVDAGQGGGKGKGKGKGAPAAPAPAVPAPAVPVSGVYDPAMPTCDKLFGYYCTDDFKATEGSQAGALCDAMKTTMSNFRGMPEPARQKQEKFCVDNFKVMYGAAQERVRQWKAGLGPGQNGVPPPATPPSP